jgi:amidohydrolase
MHSEIIYKKCFSNRLENKMSRKNINNKKETSIPKKETSWISDIYIMGVEMQKQLVEWRRIFHKYPELSMQEYNTRDKLYKILKEDLNVSIIKKIQPTGLLAILKGKKKGKKSILLRADMDALPLTEPPSSISSKNPGVMHSCGHDGHMAMLLGATQLLKWTVDHWGGTVYILFQPAEETFVGADLVSLYLKKHKIHPNAFIGMHLNPAKPNGHISFKSGPVMAGITIFRIEIEGVSTHGSNQKEGISAILAGSDWIQEVNSHFHKWVSGKYSTMNIGEINSKGAHNIVSGSAMIRGSFRTYKETELGRVLNNLYKIHKKIERIHNVKITTTIIDSKPPVNNDPELVKLMTPVVRTLTQSYDKTFVTGGSEDFGVYGLLGPSLFYFLGTDGTFPHQQDFRFDEEVLSTGTSLYTASALKYLTS